MSSNSTESSKIECKNCHQEIQADKMFLHEGFCLRNNVYCDKCQEVFLKKDFDNHIKYDHKNLTKKKKDIPSQNKNIPSQNKNNNDNELENINPNSANVNNDSLNYINENENIEKLYPIPSLEFVQMPTTELFKINEPIIIENGKIISNKNKNEFLLPHLGYEVFQNSKKSEEILDEVINNGEIFKEKNKISNNSYNIEQLKKIVNDDNINNNKLTIDSTRESCAANISNEQKNFRLSGIIDIYKQSRSNKARSFVNNINDYMEPRINNDNPIDLNEDNNSKNNNSNIINNDMITYNPNRKINKIQGLYSNQATPEKPLSNKNFIRNFIKSGPLDTLDKQSIKQNRPHTKISANNLNSNYSGLREPKDSNSKKNKKLYQLFDDKSKIKMPFNPESAKGKNNLGKKKYEFCKNLVNAEEININYKNCKKNNKKKNIRKFDIPKPKKREIVSLNEKDFIYIENTEENRIENNKKEVLNRQFNTALNLITLNNERRIMRGNISNPDRKNRKKIVKEDKKIKKKLFNVNEENIDKNFPRDSIREKHNIKTKNYYKNKRLNNMSADGSNVFFCNKMSLKTKYSIKQPTENISDEEIDPWLFCHNNGNKKDKKDLFNIFKVPKSRKIVI